MKHQVFPIIGTIITKRNRVTLWEVYFDDVLGHASATFNCDVALRPRFHVYVVSAYVGAPESIVFYMANVSIFYKRRKIALLKTVQQLDNFTIRELCCPLENCSRVFLVLSQLFTSRFLNYTAAYNILLVSHRFPGLLGSFLTFTHKFCYGWLIWKRSKLQFATGIWSQGSLCWIQRFLQKKHRFST